MDGKYSYIIYTDTGHSALLLLLYGYEREKLLISANQVDHVHIAETDFKQIVAFQEAIFKN
jgi:hypothetical protein